MKHFIEQIIEPKKLILAWQPLQKIDESRTRRAVGEIKKHEDGTISFKYLTETKDYQEAIKVGLEYYSPFLKKIEYYNSIVETFAKRLPPRKRKDFHKFLRSIRIMPDAEISDLSLLGYSGAILPSDSFSIVNTFEGVDGHCQLLLEVAGFRYYSGEESGMFLHNLGIGDIVELVPEPTNKYDGRAIKLVFSGKTIGYVNRLMAPTFNRWLKNRTVQACIEKVEGTADRPRIFLFITIS